MKTLKKLNRKVLMLATAATVIFPISVVMATTQNIDATATFRAAITLSGTALAFDTVDYSAVPSAGTDFVRVATDGSATYGGVLSAGTGATVAAGDVTITGGTNGLTLEVRCDASAQMGDGGGETIDVISIEIAAENATGAWGTTNACNGVGGAAATSLVLNLGTLDGFKIGGQIDGSSASGGWAGGAFSTATGGNDIQVDVTYQ